MPSKKVLERNQKKVSEIKNMLDNKGVYFVDYRGLSVKEIQNLRKKIKNLDSGFKVVKNRLIIKHFEKEKKETGRDIFKGPTAIAYSDEKFVEVAKVLVDFIKENKKITIKSGFLESRFVGSDEIVSISQLPSREQLMTQLALSFAHPIRKMGMALSSPLRTMLVLMQNLKDKKEKEENNNG